MTSLPSPHETIPAPVTGAVLPAPRSGSGLYRDFPDFLPDIEYESPVLVIAEISDGSGDRKPLCWETDNRRLKDCFEPLDSYGCFYIDEKGDLRGMGREIRYGTTFYLFRVFRPGICRDERLWLCDLINNAYELDGSIMEEVDRCTFPLGTDLVNRGSAETFKTGYFRIP